MYFNKVLLKPVRYNVIMMDLVGMLRMSLLNAHSQPLLSHNYCSLKQFNYCLPMSATVNYSVHAFTAPCTSRPDYHTHAMWRL